ncbi:MAG: PAS domain S-box protein, partial [Syntrophales bacterium]|nr:PAS domain S-box protein [Syntrophales bacterium]
ELKNSSFIEFVLPDDRVLVQNRHMRRMRGENFFNEYSHRIIDKDGKVKWLHVHVVRLVWRGKPAILNFASDITDRKHAEDALSESEERYRFLFHSAPAGVFYYDSSLKIIDANDVFFKIFGDEKQNPAGFQLKKLRDKKIIPSFLTPLEGKMGFYEGQYRPYNSSVAMWIFIHTAPLYGRDGKMSGGIGIIQDMTKNKKVEESLKKREKELKTKSIHLEESNAALRVLLRHRDEDRLELQRNVLSNIRELVIPYIEKLKSRQMDAEKKLLINMLENNLRDITSPFLRNMSLSQYNLTSKEIQVANLIREGKATKEIAKLLNLSTRSIEYHRDKIRNRLGLKNQKTNLRSYLLTLS